MTYITETNVSISAQPSRIAAFFDALTLKMRQRKMYRQTYNELCSMTSRDLTDLGMCRGDIRRISKEAAGLLN
jgi:uncharacterized protein YjiS (DUF1127 family)